MLRPEASAVVVHHRGLEHLLESLAALEAAFREGLTAEIVLVDNASDTPQDEVLRKHPNVRRVASVRNVGFASGCRLGAEAARAPIVLFVNDDAAVLPDAPRLLVAALAAAAPDVAAVGGRMTDRTGRLNDFSDGFLTFDGHAFASQVGRPVAALPEAVPGEERLFASGGLMVARRDEFLADGFDEDYFAYLEDVDFGWRQWIMGRRIVAEPRAVARHRGGATGEALGVFSRGFLFEKNAFSTAYKNFDREHFRALMPAVLMAFVTRVAQMLASRNAGAEELKRDPYAPEAAAPGVALLRSFFGVAEPLPGRVSIDDPLTVAHLRALSWIHRHHAALAARRRAVQAARLRSDAEIFAKFPLRIVPTYPGDERFASEFFAPFLESAPPLWKTTLEQIFEGRA